MGSQFFLRISLKWYFYASISTTYLDRATADLQPLVLYILVMRGKHPLASMALLPINSTARTDVGNLIIRLMEL